MKRFIHDLKVIWPYVKKRLASLICLFKGHKEEVYKKQTDHRQLLWICARCDTVTRELKLSQRQMRDFRKARMQHGRR